MDVNAILALIDMGALTLPRFQRGYVWKRPDVSKLMRSLYKGYPVGNLLIWETQATKQDVRGNQPPVASGHKLLLDGQQRITSLYGIIYGKLPQFSDGNPHSFRDLYFNVETEEFEFYGPTKMKHDRRWISVTKLMQKGIGPFFPQFADHPEQETLVNRLLTITNIRSRNFHVETVTGADKTMDVVVDIFNQVNSGGTKLSKGDLALAKISAEWPQAREELQKRLMKWSKAGYNFNLDWMLRCINALITGHADFAELDRQDVTTEQVKDSLQRVEKLIDQSLYLISSRLGLDYHQVLGSPNALPAIIRFFDKEKSWPDHISRNRLLYWYIHAMLWGRYSGQVETVIRQDITAIAENKDPVSALIDQLRQQRGDLGVEPQDFAGATRGSRFYPLMYMLTRVYGTRDLDSGLELRSHLLGGKHQLELHHVFPKALLTNFGYHWRNDANALANFTFLTLETNRTISAKPHEEYFPYYEAKHPGVLASHWIPDDPQLWKIENYRDFLTARRELLSKAANEFLNQLNHGQLQDTATSESDLEREAHVRPVSIASEEEEAVLHKAMDWMEQHGLPIGDFGYELLDSENELIATLDLAWPQGIQTGRGDPVALLIDEDDATLRAASSRGFTCFSDFSQLQHHVQHDILGETG